MINNRRGACVVEFALVLPLFLIVFLGMVELGRGFVIQQVLTNAAREGSRYAATDPAPSVAQVQAVVGQYLIAAKLPAATVTVTETDDHIGGKAESVTVSIPFSAVSWLPLPHYLAGVNVAATAVFQKQGVR